MEQRVGSAAERRTTVHTWFPDRDRAHLVAAAERHALDLSLAYGYAAVGEGEKRLVVNFLRHQYTDYDYGEQTSARHRATCEAVAARYPWLTEECRARIARRRHNDESDALAASAWEHERGIEQEARQAVAAASREAVRQLAIGDVAEFEDGRVRGGRRAATVTNIGRSKVTVEFTLASGEQRTRKLHASLVHRPEAAS
ncbi:hypothetical protein ACWEPB_36025 [Kitasatospora cineracea]